MNDLRHLIVETADFPEPGILFRDIGPLLRHQFAATLEALDALLSPVEWASIEAIAGVDARGFVLAAGLAARRGLGFLPIRKAGKLPPPVQRQSYRLEYGEATLEMHRGHGRVLLIDDVLATGGTLKAAADLCVASGHELAAILVLADLQLAASLCVRELPVRSLFRCG